MSTDKASHTKGPWIAVGHWVEHPDDSTPDICNCDPDSMGQEGRSDKEICANARLIAAAPDMLAALRDLERVAGIASSFDDPARVAARAAIAKAEQ